MTDWSFVQALAARTTTGENPAFYSARGVYIRLTIQYGQGRLKDGRDYPATWDEFVALWRGGGEIVRINEQGTHVGGIFLHTVRFLGADFTLATNELVAPLA